MVNRKIWRGDDYPEYRPVFRYELVTDDIDPETNLPIPFNLASCSVLVTFKQDTTDITADPTDSTALILGEITFNNDGTVAAATNLALPAGHSAADGVIHLILDRTLTEAVQPAIVLRSDLQVTDALDHDQTVEVVGTLVADDAYTNRRPT